MNESPRRLLRRVWESVRQPPSVAASRGADDLIALCDALLSERGEVSSARIASDAIAAYQQLTEQGRDAFFSKLVDQYAADPRDVNLAIEAYAAEPSAARLSALHAAAEPRRQELFRRLNTAPGGTRMLVQMRADLLQTPGSASRSDRGRQRPRSLVPGVVQPRLPGAAAHRLADIRVDSRTADPVRSRPPDSGMGRPAAPARERSALLRVLPSGAARRAAHLHRSGADPGHPRLRAAAPRPAIARRGSRRNARCAIFYSITNCQAGLRGSPSATS